MKSWLIVAIVVALFIWLQVRPSIIRSYCQTSAYDHTLNELKKINTHYSQKSYSPSYSFDPLKGFSKLEEEGKSDLELDKLLEIDRRISGSKWETLPEEGKKQFIKDRFDLEQIAAFRKEAEASYKSCEKQWGLKN